MLQTVIVWKAQADAAPTNIDPEQLRVHGQQAGEGSVNRNQAPPSYPSLTMFLLPLPLAGVTRTSANSI
jgi:hypothetical protein